jgi:hypothetical protein
MYAMISLDLDKGTSSEQRKVFYAKLKELQWKKIPKVTTTWYANFESTVSRDGIIRITRNDMKKAASAAGIASYDVVLHIGSEKPVAL